MTQNTSDPANGSVQSLSSVSPPSQHAGPKNSRAVPPSQAEVVPGQRADSISNSGQDVDSAKRNDEPADILNSAASNENSDTVAAEKLDTNSTENARFIADEQPGAEHEPDSGAAGADAANSDANMAEDSLATAAGNQTVETTEAQEILHGSDMSDTEPAPPFVDFSAGVDPTHQRSYVAVPDGALRESIAFPTDAVLEKKSEQHNESAQQPTTAGHGVGASAAPATPVQVRPERPAASFLGADEDEYVQQHDDEPGEVEQYLTLSEEVVEHQAEEAEAQSGAHVEEPPHAREELEEQRVLAQLGTTHAALSRANTHEDSRSLPPQNTAPSPQASPTARKQRKKQPSPPATETRPTNGASHETTDDLSPELLKSIDTFLPASSRQSPITPFS